MYALRRVLPATAIVATIACIGAGGTTASGSSRPAMAKFSHSTRIDNPYLPITRFQRCRLAGDDQGTELKVTRTLLERTRRFHYRGQAIDAVVVRDRVLGEGKLIELTHDYFAQDDAGTVYYLGEDVNEYRDGKVVSHEGEWRLGRDTKKIGVLMPAHPKLGDSFKSERVPHIAHETDHVVAVGAKAKAGGHSYRNVIKVRENARPPRETEFKKYARGTGVITEADGGVTLRNCS
jgi:hypothetical protein